MKKQLWLLAGGNGSGKSTFYKLNLAKHGLPFINADNIARELFPDDPESHSYVAAKLAEKTRLDLIEKGKSFCFETVFSHPSKTDFLALAKAKGYEIILVFIHLSDTSLNKARISQRVKEGGHNVPDDKVETRIPRTLRQIKTAIKIADQTHLLDNSSAEKPFRRVATIKSGKLISSNDNLPDWAKYLLDETI